jgi:hypothetical protein
MALHLTDRNVAHQIAGRIRRLIAQQDHGDITIAARRLDRSIADMYCPERLISSADQPAALDFLAAVVQSYEADAVWLITGNNAMNTRTVTSEARGTIVEVLEGLSDRLLDEVRTERPDIARVSLAAPAPSPSRDSPYPHTA